MQAAQAVLANLTDESRRKASERYEAFQAGGGGMVLREEISLDGAGISTVGEQVQVDFQRDGGQVEATPKALELPEDWQAYDRLRLEVSNPGEAMGLDLVIVGARCRIIDSRKVPAGGLATLEIDLIDLPISAGIRELYQPAGVRLVARIADGQPRSLVLESLQLLPDTRDAKRFAIDKFGQRVNGDWHNKIRSVGELRSSLEREEDLLQKLTPPPQRDEFGGWTEGPAFEATGFFRVEREDNGRWWLVNPLGNVFWSIGTTGIRTTDSTPTEGREHLYEELPDRDGPFGECYMENGFGQYRYNLMRKYGPGADWKEKWRDRVTRRFRGIGFNTVANWSEAIFLDQQVIPHVRTGGTRYEGAPMATRRHADVFDPAWETYLDGHFAELTAPCKDNPWLIGYFVDNEMPWGNMRLLSCDLSCKLRDRWLAFAQEKFADMGAFNKTFGTDFADWQGVHDWQLDEKLPEGPALEAMHEFEGIYAEQYFSKVTEYLKKHDSNHLYLGCRFVRKMPHEAIVKAAGRHAELVTVNAYCWAPTWEEFGQWYQTAQKPLLIGEHHAPLSSERQLLPLYGAFTPEQRRQYYEGYLKAFASMPWGLGCHWFQHADQPTTGRFQDGEDQTIGFVDITDQPHLELVETARAVARKVYEWHAASDTDKL